MADLAQQFMEGSGGCAVDYAEAMRLAQSAAAQGSAAGATVVGMLYAMGHGVARDDAEAVRWFERAAAVGEVAAATNLRALAAEGVREAQAAAWRLGLAPAGASGF